MDKHTKHIIVFFVTMLLASVITFSILYLLPLMTSGRAPPTSCSSSCRKQKQPDSESDQTKSESTVTALYSVSKSIFELKKSIVNSF